MKQYLNFMRLVRDTGVVKTDRTGTGTKSIFGHQMRFNLQEGFPLVTTKKIHLKSVIHELIWFLAGDTNVKYLQENGVRIWDEWADANGELGPVYGGQWRRWQDVKIIPDTAKDLDQIEKLTSQGYVYMADTTDSGLRGIATGKHLVLIKEYDQIGQVMDQLKNSPDSRRIIVSAWNVGDINQMKLPPCHSLFQFYVADMSLDERVKWYNKTTGRYIKGPATHEMYDQEGVPRQKLSCQLYQRSADIFLGVPFNIASYALLTHMFAQQCGMAVGDFIWTGGDCHIYSNHFDQVELQLSREPHPLPQLVIKRKPDSIFDYKFEDFEVVGYDPHPGIKAQVAV